MLLWMIQTEIQEILFKHKKKVFYCGDHSLEEVAQKGCGDIQNTMGHCTEQRALTALAFSRGLGLDNLQRCLPTSTFCVSVLCFSMLYTSACSFTVVEFDDKQLHKHVSHIQ